MNRCKDTSPNPMLRIHSIETFGTSDGPGIRLVVFVQGCIFRCLYCHNPDTQAIQGGKEMNTTEIVGMLERQRPYFGKKGGLTVSGGEPLVQRHALIELFTNARQAGFHTVLDTSGSILDDATRELLAYTDLVMLDVKHIDSRMHTILTGADNTKVLAFAEYCESTGKPMWLRYVLVPGYTNQPEFLHEWGKRFQSYTSVERVEILPFHTFGFYKYEKLGKKNPLAYTSPPSKMVVQSAYDVFSVYFPRVYVR